MRSVKPVIPNMAPMEDHTFFAPAFQSSIGEILKENELIASQKLFSGIFGSLSGISGILNENRQIVFANNDFLELLGVKSIEAILGKRLGEVVSCINSGTEPAGCGTSKACKYCGAVNAILESQETNNKSSRETRISSEIGGKQVSWDLNITSTPIVLADHIFYVLAVQDISSEKKLKALERVFFHDLLNIAGGLNGLLTILKMGAEPENTADLINKSEEASQAIIDEILFYRQLRAAETGDIHLNIEKIDSLEFLNSAIDRISSHSVGKNKCIIVEKQSADILFETDKTLLQRVLINTLKNALEALPEGGVVTAGVSEHRDKIVFTVKNHGVIPVDVQMQIFQRSFSTKGNDRGIGTYSMRLLTENYLRGRVSFISNEESQTVFTIELNIKFPAELKD